jgi:tRNA:m4X modification enzyme
MAGLHHLQGQAVVGVGKHVCGAATDLALRCLAPEGGAKTEEGAGAGAGTGTGAGSETERGGGVRTVGVAIALCCYHRCSWSAYVNQAFVLQHGLDAHDFGQLVKIASW